jgi:hypothetical protein
MLTGLYVDFPHTIYFTYPEESGQDKQSKQWDMDMRFGLWHIRSLYRADSLMTVSRELSIWWERRKSDGRAVEPNLLENTHFSKEKGMINMN